MKKKRTFLHLITLFHPEKWLGVPGHELSRLPHVLRNRRTLERDRVQSSPCYPEEFHGRIINNNGVPNSHLRFTLLDPHLLLKTLDRFHVQMIRTDEDGQQAKYKLEWRLAWHEPNINPLKAGDIATILQSLARVKAVGVRQLWLNPLEVAPAAASARQEGETPQVANLVLGPGTPELRKPSGIHFESDEHGVWVHYPER